MNRSNRHPVLLTSLSNPVVRRAQSCFNHVESKVAKSYPEMAVSLSVIDSPSYWAGVVEAERKPVIHRIYVTKGLVDALTTDQLVSVIAHEWGHLVKKIKGIQMIIPFAALIASAGINTGLCLLFWQPENIFAMISILTAGCLVSVFALLCIERKLGKHQEHLCDHFSASISSSLSIIQTLRRMNHLVGDDFKARKSGIKAFWVSQSSTHPSMMQRVQYIRRNRHVIKKEKL